MSKDDLSPKAKKRKNAKKSKKEANSLKERVEAIEDFLNI